MRLNKLFLTCFTIVCFFSACSQELSLSLQLPGGSAHYREDLYVIYSIKNNGRVDSVPIPKHFVFPIANDSPSKEAGNIFWELQVKSKANNYDPVQREEHYSLPFYFEENDRFINLAPQKTVEKEYPLPVDYSFRPGEYRVRASLVFENEGKNQKLTSTWIYFVVAKDYTNASKKVN